LEFGDEFNQYIRINVIPSTIKKLIFGEKFNKILIPGTLPINLKYLEFGFLYDQEILENVLPDGLKCIIFGELFNHNLSENTIPISVNKIHFNNEEYNGVFDINLNLSELMIHKDYRNNIPDNILCVIKFKVKYEDEDDDIETVSVDYEYNIGTQEYKFEYDNHEKIQEYIKNLENIKTDLILEELVSKVFNPKRIFNIGDQYNIEYSNIAEIY
jgi:hypothetical protein